MPVIFRCSKCGKILYVFNRVGQDYYGIPTPSEVISLYGGVCPHCGSRLKIPTVNNVKIMYLSSSFRYSLRYEEYGASDTIMKTAPTPSTASALNLEKPVSSEASV